MPAEKEVAARASAAETTPTGRSLRRACPWLLGVLLAAAVIWIGSPELKAPWIQGDEHIFLVNNPDVTGAAPTQPTGVRWLDIFFHAHEDLYQPVTILTYAIEWSQWGAQRVFHIRLTDVLIHALNALLLWAVFYALLRRLSGGSAVAVMTTSWALAFVWALHPMLVSAYSADMGRTHLLAATFTFLSVLLHLKSLQRGGWRWFVGAYLALLLAMLNKPMVGWVIVVFVLEWILLGLRRTLRSARLYLIGIMCAGFAGLTLWTTSETLLLEDSPLPLFGDPFARAALGLSLYLRNFVAPLRWLSFWYPPDVRTGWDYPLVWLGTLAIVAAVIGALLAARRAGARGVTVGLVWLLAMWLPVSGLIGARVLAAQDRYLYQPAVGLLLAIGVGLLYWIQRGRTAVALRSFAVAVAAVALGVAALPWDWYLCARARSTIQRAGRAVTLNPGDPRVMEFLATAYSFSRNHLTLEERLPEPPNPTALFERTLAMAAKLAKQRPHHFRDDHDRAAFHRRLSFEWWKLGQDYERLFELAPRGGRQVERLLRQVRDAGIEYAGLVDHARQMYERSLALAQRAHRFEPNAKLTWVRLAYAYRSLQRWEDARQAFERLAEVLPDDAPDYALRYTEFGDLLLHRFNDPSEALYKYRKALEDPRITPEAQRVAWLGAARCEVLAGKGSDGFELAREVLRAEPDNLEAWRVIGLYHLSSHHWEEADAVYRHILRQDPTDYEALRRFQNVCAINGKWDDAAFAWQDALDHMPGDVVYRSYFVWAAACASEQAADKWAEELLETVPNHRFACLARMLVAVRGEALDEAYEWVRRAAQGPPIPQAREFAQAELALRLMLERQELLQDAVLLRAVLAGRIGRAREGRELVERYLETNPGGRWQDVAERILAQDLAGEAPP